MKVYNLISSKTEEYEDTYAARLIEQGRASLPQRKAEPPKPKEAENKTEEAPKEAAKAAKAGKAGGK